MPTAFPPSRHPTAEPQLARDADVMAKFQVCAIGMILLALVITGTPPDSTVLLSADDYVAMMLAP
jgi:hypothetical protein